MTRHAIQLILILFIVVGLFAMNRMAKKKSGD